MRNLIATGRGGRNVLCQPFPKVRKRVSCKSFPVPRNELVISVIAVCLLYVLWLGGGRKHSLNHNGQEISHFKEQSKKQFIK